ncbi:hypothetical protein RDI58_007360 [Solanum bulbocastanum]|uniref:Uncharacterized protein n=1 Tax=Solanum bulbocastanum TaxID=147425 RepID=A0AAN8TZJ9_SOLBU
MKEPSSTELDDLLRKS